ncbi:Protein of unknown function DUF4228 [Cynara cardunculus var. scolymus]|uniref:Multidrug resistance protein ABC transporter family protein n=2 Tax=Cynara cardunculus var. scolymus TaxID=59895 RepID=A0A118JVY0_CYNCS|nr:Protein of unknown function DUF4228 [Cynara cardunculus var. scolymus]
MHASRGRRIILSDGTLQEYENPVTVAELMLDHPQQVVVEFDQKARKPTPLPADLKLETSKIYMMMPMKRSMSCEEARYLLLRANALLSSSNSFVSAYTGFLPLFARIRLAVKKGKSESQMVLKAKPGVGLFMKKEMEMEMESQGRSADYYLSRQLSGKASWKPSLDTIKEKGVKAKIRHWLL